MNDHKDRPSDMLAAIAPGLFVLLWSTGFIGSKMGAPYAEPFTFLLTRFIIVTALMALTAAIMRAPWPGSPLLAGRIALAGLLVHGVYLGGVFAAISLGLGAGITALVCGLQPLLTAVLAGPILGERVRPKQWAGLILGLLGVILVVAEKVHPGSVGFAGLPWAIGAVIGITLGTLYQKRHCSGMDLRTGAVIQYAAAGMAMAIMAFSLETRVITWSGEFIFALTWLCLVLSVGAITLLYRLIRAGAAAKVASFFYLVPPATSLIAYFLFDETLSWIALAGMGVVAAGVALANRA
ncbi:putative permease of the drug/metabolite transporter (DMT) superfamily [Rhodospirillaceae bacterium LM-1]|nr:putative permease of the drug/metabolite transporter (DMT) superfamily [Rhodospirillaceae bacterium LM-1]